MVLKIKISTVHPTLSISVIINIRNPVLHPNPGLVWQPEIIFIKLDFTSTVTKFMDIGWK